MLKTDNLNLKQKFVKTNAVNIENRNKSVINVPNSMKASLKIIKAQDNKLNIL